MGHDYTIDLDEGLEAYNRASINAAMRIADIGLDLVPSRPKDRAGSYFDGRLPADVNSMSMHDLADLMNMMTLHADYVAGLVTIAKAEKTNTDTQVGLVKAKIRKSKSGSEKSKEDATLCDERYVAVMARWLEASETLDLLNGLHEAAKRDVRVLSRLIETKKVEIEQGKASGRSQRGGRDRLKRGKR